MNTEIIKDLIGMSIALSTGFIYLKRLSLFYRIHFYQVLLSLLNYWGARFITSHQLGASITLNTAQLFNVYIIVEFFLLIIAASVFFGKKKIDRILVWASILFLIALITQVGILGITEFANYGFMIGSLILVLVYVIIIYRSIERHDNKLTMSPSIWLAVGIVIFFACNTPYMVFFRYLNEHHLELSQLLFTFITETLEIIRYLLLALSFWLYGRQQTS